MRDILGGSSAYLIRGFSSTEDVGESSGEPRQESRRGDLRHDVESIELRARAHDAVTVCCKTPHIDNRLR